MIVGRSITLKRAIKKKKQRTDTIKMKQRRLRAITFQRAIQKNPILQKKKEKLDGTSWKSNNYMGSNTEKKQKKKHLQKVKQRY